MKIIHTADWHLGKVLHKQELTEETELFLQWLINLIRRESIDALLVSGDVFDLANPSHKDLTQYYNFLNAVSDTGIQIIITGGNHDSVSQLHTTRSLLSTRGIHVIGGMPDNRNEVVIPLANTEGKPVCLVLAVPFLRERDLRKAESADTSGDRYELVSSAIRDIYQESLDAARTMYNPELPVMAMGHLYMQGASTSDSERDIHVGTLQGFSHALFPENIQYFALGHIHKPQRVSKSDRIRYSGSPVYLDFSEAGYDKQIILIELDDAGNNMQIHPVPVPCFRQLVRWSGPLPQLMEQLRTFSRTSVLQAWAEITVLEENYDPGLIAGMEELASMTTDEVKIIKCKIDFVNKPIDTTTWDTHTDIRQMTPLQVLQQKLETGVPEENWDELRNCFALIVDEVMQQTP